MPTLREFPFDGLSHADLRKHWRQLWRSGRRPVRIGAWCRARMPLSGAGWASQREVAGKRCCLRCSAGTCPPALGHRPLPLRTVAWSSARCHSPRAVVSTPRGALSNDVARCALRGHGGGCGGRTYVFPGSGRKMAPPFARPNGFDNVARSPSQGFHRRWLPATRVSALGGSNRRLLADGREEQRCLSSGRHVEAAIREVQINELAFCVFGKT